MGQQLCLTTIRVLFFSVVQIIGMSAVASRPAFAAEVCAPLLSDPQLTETYDIFERHRVVLDTNAIIDDPEILERFSNSEVILPAVVLRELDHNKSNPKPSVAYSVRKFVRIFRELPPIPGKPGVFRINENSTLRMVETPKGILPPDFDTGEPDMKILAVAMQEYLLHQDMPFTLLTSDTILYKSAQSTEVPTHFFRDIKHGPTFPNVLPIDVTEEQLAQFKATGELPYSNPLAIQNQFILLRSPHDSPESDGILARFETGQNLPEKVSGSDEARQLMFSLHEGKIIKLKYAGEEYDGVVQPKNIEQRMALEVLLDPNIPLVFLEGKAGTGKTILAMFASLMQTKRLHPANPPYDQILLSRSAVNMGGEEHGFLKGDLEEKTENLYFPYKDNHDVIAELLAKSGKDNSSKSKGSFDTLYKKQVLAFTRGRTFTRTLWIVDETQNLTADQLDTILTRLGEGSKLIIMADPSQIDPPITRASSGFEPVSESYRGIIGTAHVKMITAVRSAMAEITSEVRNMRLNRR
jgi:PhoH-like ATPase